MNDYLTDRMLKLPDGTMPHIAVKGGGDVADYVLLSGSPARVEVMKDYLTDFQRIGSQRGYVLYTGSYQGVMVTVATSGMGAPSSVAIMEELAYAGGRTFIRVGSCASISPGIEVGDIVVATAAVRDEGTSSYYAPEIYPAVADHGVVAALCRAAEGNSQPIHLGIIRSTDSFYEGERKTEIIDKWCERGVLAFEMESSALFTVASVLGFRAGAVCVPGSNLLKNRSTYNGEDIDPYRAGIEKMITLTLDAVVALAAKDEQ